MPKRIHCPKCRKLTLYDPKNSFRPFCSERCRILDLGAWADEKYKIAQDGEEDNVNENPENALILDDSEDSDDIMIH